MKIRINKTNTNTIPFPKLNDIVLFYNEYEGTILNCYDKTVIGEYYKHFQPELYEQ